MSVNVNELTERDIRNYKRDIESYRKRQDAFLVLGFVFLGLFIICLVVGILGAVAFVKAIDNENAARIISGALMMEIGFAFSVIFSLAMIAMFVLRAALFGRKIENRQRIIEEWEIDHR